MKYYNRYVTVLAGIDNRGCRLIPKHTDLCTRLTNAQQLRKSINFADEVISI